MKFQCQSFYHYYYIHKISHVTKHGNDVQHVQTKVQCHAIILNTSIFTFDSFVKLYFINFYLVASYQFWGVGKNDSAAWKVSKFSSNTTNHGPSEPGGGREGGGRYLYTASRPPPPPPCTTRSLMLCILSALWFFTSCRVERVVQTNKARAV